MRKSFALIFIITYWLLTTNNFSQITQQWVAIYNGPGNTHDSPCSVAVDDSGNVYVAGQSTGSTSSCITTVKYNSSGIQQWTARFFDNGNGGAEAHSLKLDKYGNVYITGSVCTGSGQDQDIVTLKYNPAGIQQWAAVYHIPNANGWGCDLVVDSACNVYVTGTYFTSADSSDIVTIKYDSSGAAKWVSVYNGPTGYTDLSSKILIDRNGNLYVKGISWVTQLFFEYTVIKYNNSGVQQWVIRQFGSDNTSYYHGSLALDGEGNIYLAASSGAAGMQCYLTAKYNPSGNIQWMAIYNTNSLPSQCETSSLALDAYGNVYVTGECYSPANLSLQGCTTIKYNSQGVEQWVRVFNGNNYTAAGTKTAVDSEGGIYVLGSVDNGGSAGYDYLLLKYDSSGTQQWITMYDGPGGNTDMARGIVVDKYKNIYVTGWCGGLSGSADFATIKYSQPIGIKPVSTEIPVGFKLYQNYPNPFNPSTKIKFSLPLPSEGGAKNVQLIIYDVLGKEIANLIPPFWGGKEGLQPGSYEVEWNASNYPSGVYFYKLTAENYTDTKKMVLLK